MLLIIMVNVYKENSKTPSEKKSSCTINHQYLPSTPNVGCKMSLTKRTTHHCVKKLDIRSGCMVPKLVFFLAFCNQILKIKEILYVNLKMNKLKFSCGKKHDFFTLFCSKLLRNKTQLQICIARQCQ